METTDVAYGELSLPPVWTGRNKLTGRFLKGHVPANKGKKWDEYMGKRAQKRAAKGWKNLDLHRHRSDNAGRSPKQVVAVFDDGQFLVFPYIGEAAKWLDGSLASRHNIGRCCRFNESRKVCKNDYRKGERKGASRINTNHRYKGIRWYFESDSAWTTKIKQFC